MFTVLSFPPSSHSSRQVADLITDYAAYDRLRRWRRDLLKSGGTLSVIAMIAAAFDRMSVPECEAALVLFLVPPAAAWLVECRRWRGLWRQLNKVPVGLIRKS